MQQARNPLPDFVFGLAWAMVLVPVAAGIKGLEGSQWLLLAPTIPVLGFFLGWLIQQYRRLDVVGTQRHSWLTVRQRQSWYKRLRLLAAGLFVQTLVVFLVIAMIRGEARLLLALGTSLGLI